MQSAIHEVYEYQDYFTVSIILQLMLRQTDAEIIIDRKDFSGLYLAGVSDTFAGAASL